MTDAPVVSPLATAAPWDLVASSYAAEILPVFEQFSDEALRAAGVGEDDHVADVAAGPGTLSVLAARRGARVAALDFSPGMIEQLRARLDDDLGERINAVVGDGMALPWGDGLFDAGFSMFGLMFFPDRARGFAELARVLRPGATCVVSSWVPMDRVPLMAAMYSTFEELLPGPKPPPRAMPLLDAATCRDEMTAGGFHDVRVYESAASVEVPSITELLAQSERSNAPIVLMKRRLGEAWAPLAATVRERMIERFGDGPQQLTMTANMMVGQR